MHHRDPIFILVLLHCIALGAACSRLGSETAFEEGATLTVKTSSNCSPAGEKLTDIMYLIYRSEGDDDWILEEIRKESSASEFTISSLGRWKDYCILAIAGQTPSKAISFGNPLAQLLDENRVSMSWNPYNPTTSSFTYFGKGMIRRESGRESTMCNISLSRCWSRVRIGSILRKKEWNPSSTEPQKLTLERAFILNAPAEARYDGAAEGEKQSVLSEWIGGQVIIDTTAGIKNCLCNKYESILLKPGDTRVLSKSMDILPCSPATSASLVIECHAEFDSGMHCTWYYPIELNGSERLPQQGHCYSYTVSISGPGARSPIDAIPHPCDLQIDLRDNDWEEGGELDVIF